MPFLNIYIKRTGSKKNPPCITLVYIGDGDVIPYRTLKFRGIANSLIASRPCDQEEMDGETNPYRMTFLNYFDWDKLIADEKKWTNDQAWHSKLDDLKEKNKFIQIL